MSEEKKTYPFEVYRYKDSYDVGQDTQHATYEYKLKSHPTASVFIMVHNERVEASFNHGRWNIDDDYIEELITMLDAAKSHVKQIKEKIRVEQETRANKRPYHIKIEDLELPANMNNYLKRAGIYDAGTLCGLDFKTLRDIRGIGWKSIVKIAIALRKNEYEFEWAKDFDVWFNTKEDE